ncbi:MAG TPA: hypothetical protein VKG44_05100 [Candidatus Baltobacteraceae bacterium]|nr:hypothetical protein [Candidatus Baltobacteraceae bacterium]
MQRFVLTLVLAGFALAVLPASAADTSKVFAMTAQNGSGENGTVVLTSMGDKTKVEVAIVGAPAGVSQPVHIHDGTCATLNPKPKYGLSPIVDGVSTTVVDVSMASLAAAPFAVNAHKSATEIATYVSCATISTGSKM